MHRKITALLLCMMLVASAFCSCTSVDTGTSPETEKAPTGPTETGAATDTVQTDSLTNKTDVSKPEAPLFRYDKYMLSSDARNFLTDREEELYRKMVDSVMEHNSVVEGFDSIEEYSRVIRAFRNEFVTSYHMMKESSYEDGKAVLEFVGDKEVCDANYAVIEDAMNDGLALIKPEDSDWQRIAKLHLYVSGYIKYGHPYPEYNVYHTFYNCIKYKIGTCGVYAEFLNLLAMNAGFEVCLGYSLGKNGATGADHMWSMIRVEGQWYHFDACWQSPRSSGLYYFAISTEERYTTLSYNNKEGVANEVDMYYINEYNRRNKTELPYCENSMSDADRRQLYYSVIDDYLKGTSRES